LEREDMDERGVKFFTREEGSRRRSVVTSDDRGLFRRSRVEIKHSFLYFELSISGIGKFY